MSLRSRGNIRPSESILADWFTPGRFAVLFGLLIVVTFPLVIAGFETFFYDDFGQFGYPVASYHREAIWRGEIPLWNPLNNCGTPFLAQWNTLTLYPPSLFYVLFPISWSLDVFCLGHLLLAGLGMYFLAYRWTGNRLAAALAGTAFGFNGLTWYGLVWPNNIAALAWMPWLVLALERGWREGGRSVAYAALAGAMQMLAGAPEVIIQTWFLAGVLWLAEFWMGRVLRVRLAVRALGIGALVAGLTAAQMLPFLDLLTHSQRGANFGDATMQTMPASGWANYLAPLFHCSRSPMGLFIQKTQSWAGSYYLGAGIAALALLAVWRVRTGRVRLLAAVALFSLIMALGAQGYLYPLLLRFVPLLGLMRFPIKFVVLATFVIPLLAACGLARLQSLPTGDARREWKNAIILALALAVTTGAIVFCAWRFPQPMDDPAATSRNAFFRMVFMGLMLVCVAGLRLTENFRFQRWLQAALVVFLWCDILTHAPNLSPTVTRSTLEPGLIRQFFNWDTALRPGVSRALQSRASFWRMLTQSAPTPELDVTGRRLSLFLNFNLLDDAAKFDGFYSLESREYSDVFKRVRFGTNETEKLQDFLGIALTSDPTNDVGWVVRPSALPFITAGQEPVFAGDADALQTICSGAFDPSRVVYLPLEASGQVHAVRSTAARVISPQFSAQRIDMDVEAEAPAIVVVAQAYYHDWRVYVDGAAAPLWLANYAFQALEVPAGRHHVSLVYEDREFRWGSIISVATLLGLGVKLAMGARKRSA